MAQIIEQETNIRSAIQKFRKIIKEASFENEVLQWAFPNGEKANLGTYKLNTRYGTLGVGIPKEQWNTRVPHLFTLSLNASTISPDVEINIPLTLDRRVSGVYVKKGADIWLCSRGMFTAYRGKIKRELTFAHFDKWLLDVDDAEKTAYIIPIAALTSPDIANQIANFVLSVNELKEKYKNEDIEEVSPTNSIWNNSLEYEGKKTKNSAEIETEYEYLHGPLCNDLQRQLEKIISKRGQSVAKNINIDVALTENNKAIAIFEVKTSCSLSAQLYKGIGQLLSYKHYYGKSETELFLVVPSIESNRKKLCVLMDDLGIHLVESKKKGFFLSNGSELNEFLRKQKIV
ncbi:MAG: hypothetical protein D3921_04470 [Candidatus Electrothrix sp. AW1]|nr:hypothetical protein [Candidatus Electrothrix sp. AX1]MCI5181764.1 hypothetical protein [Candidatus Electrothrix gigas]